MRRRTAALAAVAGVLVLGGTGVGVVALAVPSTSSAETRIATSTVPVTRGDLVDSTLYPGVLGYGAPQSLVSSAAGIVTSVTAFGSVVRLGGTLYSVDERPVVAFHGVVPVYRPMSWGMKGGDVRQLNTSLRALGSTAVPDSDEFGRETARAVRAWQTAHGHAATGIIGADQMAFVPGDVRVSSVTAHVGSSASGPVLDYTSTTRVVTSSVTTRQASAFTVGKKVEVGLADGTTATARVVSRSSHATTQPGAGDESADSTVDTTMAFDIPPAKAAPGEQLVDVRVPGASRRHVLSVPVAALVVHPDGGYQVEVESAKGLTRVAVKLGLFAQGRVEVSGTGLAEGARVVVPS